MKRQPKLRAQVIRAVRQLAARHPPSRCAANENAEGRLPSIKRKTAALMVNVYINF
jgi:hypothetical protein